MYSKKRKIYTLILTGNVCRLWALPAKPTVENVPEYILQI